MDRYHPTKRDLKELLDEAPCVAQKLARRATLLSPRSLRTHEGQGRSSGPCLTSTRDQRLRLRNEDSSHSFAVPAVGAGTPRL